MPIPSRPAVRAALRTVRRLGGVVALLAVPVLAGCSATPSATEPSPGPSGTATSAVPDPGVQQVRPGGPGGPTTTLAADATVGTRDWNHADLAFVQMMVPHHRQALEMAALAEERAASPAVLALARRIDATQAVEVALMVQWLQDQGVAVPQPGDHPSLWDHGEHGHDGMAGMLSDTELRALAAASGAEFDRLFLEGMVGHHEGALVMARDVLAAGSDGRVLELADDVNAGQAPEIDRMERLLASLA